MLTWTHHGEAGSAMPERFFIVSGFRGLRVHGFRVPSSGLRGAGQGFGGLGFGVTVRLMTLGVNG